MFVPTPQETSFSDQVQETPGKRKVHVNQTDRLGYPAKRRRGNRGKLKQMMDMPFDILEEIFGRLHPLDLLHLSRTTKEVRAFLLNRSSAVSIWTMSLSATIPFPKCPPEISEPTCAHLLFEKTCHYCLRPCGVHLVWTAGVKICRKCKDNETDFVPWAKLPFKITSNTAIQILKKHIPTIELKRRIVVLKTLYSLQTLEAWLTELEFVDNHDQWCMDKIKKLEVIDQYGKSCEQWLEQYNTIKKHRLAEEQESRVDLLLVRVLESEWGEEAILRGDYLRNELRGMDVVRRVSSRPFTPVSLSFFDSRMNSHFYKLRTVRIETERKPLYAKLLAILKMIVDKHVETLPMLSFYPTLGEVFRDPEVQNVFEEIISNGWVSTNINLWEVNIRLFGIIPMFPTIVERWQSRIETELLRVIRDQMHGPKEEFDIKAALQLPTTVFACKKCGATSLRYPWVMMHACATMFLSRDGGVRNGIRSLPYPGVMDNKEKAVYVFHDEVYWNSCRLISYSSSRLGASEIPQYLKNLHQTAENVQQVQHHAVRSIAMESDQSVVTQADMAAYVHWQMDYYQM